MPHSAQVECAQFLLTRAPGLHSGSDQNGDCALHAAASTGALGCLRLLLANAQVNVDAENALGMRAVHMVQTEKCLEMLVARDAEICCEDHQQRTPLFVACAMNRSGRRADSKPRDQTHIILSGWPGMTAHATYAS